MLTKLKIEGFKIHKSTELNLKNLNILTGINSSGKTSVIQSLLLLRQSYLSTTLSDGLQLNGNLCDIGLSDDAICRYADDDRITFNLCEDDTPLLFVFGKEGSSIKDMVPLMERPSNMEHLNKYALFSNRFQYISASRWEPKESYPLKTTLVESKNQISEVKGQCELVVHYLHQYKDTPINAYLKQDGYESLLLKDQVSAWENVISKGVNVIVRPIGNSFALNYSYANVVSHEFKATNVGFGLSYALPVIVALLSAQKGDLIIIENPETHLHPAGQSEIAKLISYAAQNGVQIIVETHSDHIINGILVATKRFENGERGIDKENVNIVNFKKDESSQTAIAEPITIIGDGKISVQPEGFFDQTEKDLGFLLGF